MVVVEDNETLRLVVSMALEFDCDGEIVGQAADGRAGIEVIREARPELVVVDLHMPGMGGLELIEAVRAEELPVRLVAFSADELLLQTALTAGADAAVCKRDGTDELIRIVNEVARSA